MGSILVRETRGDPRRTARIVDVEAYDGADDRASHARFGQTPRNASMYGPPGTAYVYLVYGMHDLLNVAAGPAGQPSAILIRAVQPLEGLDAMRTARVDRALARRRGPVPEGARAQALARIQASGDDRLIDGPGLVSAILDVDRAFNGIDLLDPHSALHIEATPARPGERIVAMPRVGIDYAGEPWRSIPWRFALAGR